MFYCNRCEGDQRQLWLVDQGNTWLYACGRHEFITSNPSRTRYRRLVRERYRMAERKLKLSVQAAEVSTLFGCVREHHKGQWLKREVRSTRELRAGRSSLGNAGYSLRFPSAKHTLNVRKQRDWLTHLIDR